jgi:hypothetical protein
MGIVNVPLLTATFRELGPPDLVHVVKSTGRAGALDVRGLSTLLAFLFLIFVTVLLR